VKRSRVLYIFHKSLTETIPRLHGLNLVHALSRVRPFTVVSFEPPRRGRSARDLELYERTRSWLREAGVRHVGVPLVGSRWVEIPLGALVVLWNTVFGGVRIVHARSYFPALMGLPVAALTGARFVFDMRGLFVDEYLFDGAFRPGTFRLSFARWLEGRLIAGSDAIVAVSEPFREHLTEGRGLNRKARAAVVRVIPNRVETQRFEDALQRRSQLRRDRGWEGSTVVVFVGSRSRWHRLDRTMEIMSEVMSRSDSVRFVAAVYPDTSEAERLAGLAGVPRDRLEVVTLPIEAVPELLAAADLGMMLIDSHVSKAVSAPIKFSEYMAAGLPTVASANVGDTQCWIEERRLGLVVDHERGREAASRILELLQAPDFREGRMRERCLRFASEALDMKITIGEYERIYEELECPSGRH
jgi:glycosyltransferase involved in cell wall biosynthesis